MFELTVILSPAACKFSTGLLNGGEVGFIALLAMHHIMFSEIHLH